MKKNPTAFLPALVAGVASILAASIACADNVFVVSNGGNSVQEISNNTVTTFIATDLNSPTGIAIYDGDFYVSNNGTNGAGYIAEFNSSGQFITNYSTGENGPRGLAFNSAGDLFVTNQTSGQIVEIPTGGGTGSLFVSGLNYPNGIAFDTNPADANYGDLFVANGGSSTIDKILPNGTVLPFAGGLNSPNGIAINSAGDVMAVNHNTSQVLEYSPGGTFLGSVIPPAFSSSLNQPKTLALDSGGDFYVTDYGDNTVTEYGPGGALIGTYNTDALGNSAFNGPCFVTTELVVPEPSTCALLVAGLGFLFFVARRKTTAMATLG